MPGAIRVHREGRCGDRATASLVAGFESVGTEMEGACTNSLGIIVSSARDRFGSTSGCFATSRGMSATTTPTDAAS
jgi:hypothetical protein